VPLFFTWQFRLGEVATRSVATLQILVVMPFGRKPPVGGAVPAAFDWATFENKPLLFVHIPKTAGSSFRHSIAVSQLCLYLENELHAPSSSRCGPHDTQS